MRLTPFKTYLQLALVCILCAFSCYIIKMFRFPGDTIIVRHPDSTLHDIIYFNAENFVNMFGLITCVNLCYFICAAFPAYKLAYYFKYILLTLGGICFIRTMFHFFTYCEIIKAEYVLDCIIFIIGIIKVISYNLNHTRNADSTSNATHTGVAPQHH